MEGLTEEQCPKLSGGSKGALALEGCFLGDLGFRVKMVWALRFRTERVWVLGFRVTRVWGLVYGFRGLFLNIGSLGFGVV